MLCCAFYRLRVFKVSILYRRLDILKTEWLSCKKTVYIIQPANFALSVKVSKEFSPPLKGPSQLTFL